MEAARKKRDRKHAVRPGFFSLDYSTIAGSGTTTVSARRRRTTQKTFSTPEQAGQALRAAAGDDDEGALTEILGPDSKDILFSGDAAEDKASLAASRPSMTA